MIWREFDNICSLLFPNNWCAQNFKNIGVIVVPTKSITLVLVTLFLGIPKILYSFECLLFTILFLGLLVNDVRML